MLNDQHLIDVVTGMSHSIVKISLTHNCSHVCSAEVLPFGKDSQRWVFTLRDGGHTGLHLDVLAASEKDVDEWVGSIQQSKEAAGTRVQTHLAVRHC